MDIITLTITLGGAWLTTAFSLGQFVKIINCNWVLTPGSIASQLFCITTGTNVTIDRVLFNTGGVVNSGDSTFKIHTNDCVVSNVNGVGGTSFGGGVTNEFSLVASGCNISGVSDIPISVLGNNNNFTDVELTHSTDFVGNGNTLNHITLNPDPAAILVCYVNGNNNKVSNGIVTGGAGSTGLWKFNGNNNTLTTGIVTGPGANAVRAVAASTLIISDYLALVFWADDVGTAGMEASYITVTNCTMTLAGGAAVYAAYLTLFSCAVTLSAGLSFTGATLSATNSSFLTSLITLNNVAGNYNLLNCTFAAGLTMTAVATGVISGGSITGTLSGAATGVKVNSVRINTAAVLTASVSVTGASWDFTNVIVTTTSTAAGVGAVNFIGNFNGMTSGSITNLVGLAIVVSGQYSRITGIVAYGLENIGGTNYTGVFSGNNNTCLIVHSDELLQDTGAGNQFIGGVNI